MLAECFGDEDQINLNLGKLQHKITNLMDNLL